jgi:hypothetical protein
MKIEDIAFLRPDGVKFVEVNICDFEEIHEPPRPKDWVKYHTGELGGIMYGGYMEDRSPLFDERHITESTIHLGVDVWLPKNCSITFPHLKDSKLLYRSSDVGYVGGWGGRKDYLYNDEVWIFAHLNPNHELFLKNTLDEFDRIGRLGSKSNNGGWTPHLHIQRMSYEGYKTINVEDLDGYAKPDDPIIKEHINPFS